MADQPWEAQDEGKVCQRHQLQGNVLLVLAMDANAGGVVVGDGSCRAAVDEFDRDGMGVGLGLKQVGCHQGGVQKGARGAGVNEGEDRDGEVTWDE